MSYVTFQFKKIIETWNCFWFQPVSLFNLAVFRIILCGTLFWLYVERHRDLQMYFSDRGMVSSVESIQLIPEFYRPMLNTFLWGENYFILVHGVFLLLLFLLTLGIGGRWLAIPCWFIHMSFLHRNYSIAFGADLIGGIFLFYLSLTQSCKRLSLSNFISNKIFNKKQQIAHSDLFTSVFYRFAQLQLCIIYAYSGFEKLKGQTWWDGMALWNVFANPQMTVVDMTWTRFVPWVIPVITYTTILFEIYFCVLAWIKPTRLLFLTLGVLFHIGIGSIMALHAFALVMIAPYVLFLQEEEALKIFNQLKFKRFNNDI